MGATESLPEGWPEVLDGTEEDAIMFCERLRPLISTWWIHDVESMRKKLMIKIAPQPTGEGGVDVQLQNHRVDWPTFFRLMEEMMDEIEQKKNAEYRKQFHPACKEFAMTKDETAALPYQETEPEPEDASDTIMVPVTEEDKKETFLEKLKKRLKQALGAVKALATQIVPKKEGEEDAESTVNAEGTEGAEKKSEEKTADEAISDPDKETKSETKSESKSETKSEPDPKEEDISLEDNPDIPRPSGGSSEVDLLIKVHDEFKPSSKGPTRVYPIGWDPNLVSPMFFGYTSDKEAEVDQEAIAAKQRERDEQDQWDNLQIERTSNAYTALKAEHEQKTEFQRKALIKRKKKREDDKASRKRKFDQAQRQMEKEEEMLALFNKNWHHEEAEVAKKEKEEDEKSVRDELARSTKMGNSLHALGEKLRFLETEKEDLMLKPRGEILIGKYIELVKEAQVELKELEAQLKEKEKMLALLQKDKKTPKGALIMGEGEVEKAKKKVEDQNGELHRLMTCGKRASQLRAREEVFVPLFDLIRSVTDPVFVPQKKRKKNTKKPTLPPTPPTTTTTVTVTVDNGDVAIARATDETKTEDKAGAVKSAETKTEDKAGAAKSTETKTEDKVGAAKSAETKTEDKAGAAKSAETKTEDKAAVKSAEPKAEGKDGAVKSAEPKAEDKDGAAKSAEPKAEDKDGAAKSAETKTEDKAGSAKSAETKTDKDGAVKSAEPKAEDKDGAVKSAEPKTEDKDGAAKSAETKTEDKDGAAQSAEPKAEDKDGAVKSAETKTDKDGAVKSAEPKTEDKDGAVKSAETKTEDKAGAAKSDETKTEDKAGAVKSTETGDKSDAVEVPETKIDSDDDAFEEGEAPPPEPEKYEIDVLSLCLLVSMLASAGDDSVSRLRWCFAVFDSFGIHKLTRPQLVQLLGVTARCLWSVGGLSVGRVPVDELRGIVSTAMFDQGLGIDGQTMDIANFVEWASQYIRRTPRLSWVYGVVCYTQGVSDYQQQHMQPVQKLRSGLDSMTMFIRTYNRNVTSFRKCMSQENKVDIHTRALNRGAEDPLKRDYTVFVTRKKKTGDAVELLNGWYAHLDYYSLRVATKAAMRIQRSRRARRGRNVKHLYANRAALMGAQHAAKQKIARKIRRKFEKNERLKNPLKRMNWEAKLRMFQVKISAQSQVSGEDMADRASALKQMQAEMIAVHWKRIDEQFAQMEKDTDLTLGGIMAFRDTIAAVIQPPVPLPDDPREVALIKGNEYPDNPYYSETVMEARLRRAYSGTSPPPSDLLKRLRQMRVWMTFNKANKIILELPAKRLLLQRFAFMEPVEITRFFTEHFLYQEKHAAQMQDMLTALCYTDWESGFDQRRINTVVKTRENALVTFLGHHTEEQLTVTQRTIDKERARPALADNKEGQDLAVLERTNRKAKEVNKLRKRLRKLKKEAKHKQKQVRETETLLRLVEEQLLLRQAVEGHTQSRSRLLRVQPHHRINWMRRFYDVMELPEKDPKQRYVKYKELSSLMNDFIRFCVLYAKIIVGEFFVDSDKKVIPPIKTTPTDLAVPPPQKSSKAPAGEEGARAVKVSFNTDTERIRQVFEVNNIRFKVAQDGDGLYDGNHLNAMKAFGNEIRNSKLFFRKTLLMMRSDDEEGGGPAKRLDPAAAVPLQTCIDFLGMRVMATAICPLQFRDVDPKTGEVGRSRTQLMYGSEDRMYHLKAPVKRILPHMVEFAETLNLKHHYVMGRQDVNRFGSLLSADMRVYAGTDGRVYFMHMRNAMPSEAAEPATHLEESWRQLSVYWRQLRPELVKRLPVPLSADAMRVVTMGCGLGAAKDTKLSIDITKDLLDNQIPKFANEIADTWTAEMLDSDKGVNWSRACHTRGINIRHLGLLRTRFWFRLDGVCDAFFNENVLHYREADWRVDVRRGAQLKVDDVYYRVPFEKEGEVPPFTKDQVPITPKCMNKPKQDLVAMTGEVRNPANSELVRKSLFVEIIMRCVKGIVRNYARESARVTGLTSESAFSSILVKVLNLVTGAADGSLRWYREELLSIVKQRFGPYAVSARERRNPLLTVAPVLARVVKRLGADLCFQIDQGTERRFKKQPLHFRFEGGDIVAVDARVRINGQATCDFASAMVLAAMATDVSSNCYRKVVLSDSPAGYWPLTDQLGSTHAENLGSTGQGLRGVYHPGVKYNVKGYIRSDSGPLGPKATGFNWDDVPLFVNPPEPKDEDSEDDFDPTVDPTAAKPEVEEKEEKLDMIKKAEKEHGLILLPGDKGGINDGIDGPASRKGARISVISNKRLNPMHKEFKFSVELWASVKRGSHKCGMLRVAMSSGRYRLGITRYNRWCFAVYSADTAAESFCLDEEPCNEEQWYHLVGTYDGTYIRLFVDGALRSLVNVRGSELERAVALAKHREKLRKEYIADEEAELFVCREKALEMVGSQLRTKDGKKAWERKATLMAQKSRLQAKMNAQSRINAGSGFGDSDDEDENAFRVLSFADAKRKIKRELVDQRHNELMSEVKELFRSKQEKLTNQEQAFLSAATNRAKRPITLGCDSNIHKYFHGSLGHAAVYPQALTPHRIYAHFVNASQDLKMESQRLFALATDKFKKALTETPNDPRVLEGYASSLCGHYPFVVDQGDGFESAAALKEYSANVTEAVNGFEMNKNAGGLAAIIRHLKREYRFWHLLRAAWSGMVNVDRDYYAKKPKAIWDLPSEFGLLRPGAEPEMLQTAASMFQAVVRADKRTKGAQHYGNKDSTNKNADLSWIQHLDNAVLTCEIVRYAMDGIDLRRIDLNAIDWGPSGETLSASDFDTLTDKLRDSRALNLCGLDNLRPANTVLMAKRVTFLVELRADGCLDAIDDQTLLGLAMHCRKLRVLSLAHCKHITDQGIEYLCKGDTRPGSVPIRPEKGKVEFDNKGLNLNELCLAHCMYVSDASLRMLGKHMRHLTALDLSWCITLTSEGIEEYCNGSAKHLLRLSLQGCSRIGDNGVMAVADNFSELEYLDIAFVNKISQKSVRHVVHSLWSLRHFNLQDVHRLEDISFLYDHKGDGRYGAEKNMLSKIEFLNLEDCSLLTPAGLMLICNQATKLTHLNVGGCVKLDDTMMKTIAVNPINDQPRNRKLSVLCVSFIPSLTDKAVRDVFAYFPELADFRVSGCPQVTDFSMLKLAETLECIQHLEIGHCRQITDRSVEALAEHLWMEHVDISFCSKMTDVALVAIAKGCQGARHLNASRCPKITETGVDAVLRECTVLEFLDLSQCIGIDESKLGKWRRSHPRVRIICEGIKNLTESGPAAVASRNRKTEAGTIHTGGAVVLS